MSLKRRLIIMAVSAAILLGAALGFAEGWRWQWPSGDSTFRKDRLADRVSNAPEEKTPFTPGPLTTLTMPAVDRWETPEEAATIYDRLKKGSDFKVIRPGSMPSDLFVDSRNPYIPESGAFFVVQYSEKLVFDEVGKRWVYRRISIHEGREAERPPVEAEPVRLKNGASARFYTTASSIDQCLIPTYHLSWQDGKAYYSVFGEMTSKEELLAIADSMVPAGE